MLANLVRGYARAIALYENSRPAAICSMNELVIAVFFLVTVDQAQGASGKHQQGRRPPWMSEEPRPRLDEMITV